VGDARRAVAVGPPTLSQPETLAIHILPIIMIASPVLPCSKMTTAARGRGTRAQQKMMEVSWPLMFGFFLL